MTAQHGLRLCRIVLRGAFFSTMFPGAVMAAVSDQPFVLRLMISLDRSSNFSDTAGRQASIAFPGGSSDNPAATDWQPRSDLNPAAAFTNIHAVSSSGAWITAEAATVNVKLPDSGTLSLAYARTDTNQEETRQGLSDNLRSNEFFATYSRRIDEKVAVGGTLRFTDSVLKEQYFEPRVGGLALESKVESRLVDFSLGLLTEPRSGWFAGGVMSMSWGKSDAVIRNAVPLPALFGMVPEGTALDRFGDDIWSLGARAGMGYAHDPTYGVYLDAQYLIVHSKKAGSVEVARIMTGLDLRLSRSVVLRAGVGVDSDQDVTLSIGASYRGGGPLSVDVAYQHNGQPEIRREFGRFDLLSASLSYRF